MPTTPYAKLIVRLDGGAPQTGGIVASGGEEVTLELENTNGVTWYLWQIFSWPPAWAGPGDDWFLNEENNCWEYYAASPPAFDLPLSSSLWGKWLLRVTVNRGYAVAGLYDETTAIEIVSPEAGLHDLAFLEGSQFGGDRGHVGPQQENLRELEDFIAGADAEGGTVIPSVLVWDPGSSDPGVYTTEPALWTAYGGAFGRTQIFVQATSVNIGLSRAYSGRAELVSLLSTVTTSAGVVLSGLALIRSTRLILNTSSAPALGGGDAGNVFIRLVDAGTIEASSADNPAILLSADAFFFFDNTSGFDGSHPVLHPDGHTAKIYLSNGARLKNNTITGGDTESIVEVYVGDPGCTVGTTQTGYGGKLRIFGDYVGAWSSTGSYMKGACVLFASHAYTSLVDDNLDVEPGSDPTKWEANGASGGISRPDSSEALLWFRMTGTGDQVSQGTNTTETLVISSGSSSPTGNDPQTKARGPFGESVYLVDDSFFLSGTSTAKPTNTDKDASIWVWLLPTNAIGAVEKIWGAYLVNAGVMASADDPLLAIWRDTNGVPQIKYVPGSGALQTISLSEAFAIPPQVPSLVQVSLYKSGGDYWIRVSINGVEATNSMVAANADWTQDVYWMIGGVGNADPIGRVCDCGLVDGSVSGAVHRANYGTGMGWA